MQRKSGVLMHVSSLWGEYSVGSFGKAARQFIDILKEGGFSVWQVLPFCLADECNSPYKSHSAFSIDPKFIDLDILFEKGLITSSEREAARQHSPHLCEFDRLHTERMQLLSLASERFDHTLCEQFFASHPHTAKFCEFMALKAANGGKEWQEWSTDTPDEKALLLWRFCQFEAFTEWAEIKKYANGAGIEIVGDIPIYVALDSSDVWEAPQNFLLDKRKRPTDVAGVPPDYFSKDGQLWGNPLYNWKQMKADGYSWWRERIHFMSELFDAVRIDHFRGLESYFAIPATDTNARRGKWKKGPGMSLIRAIREASGDMGIIAEDLGVITPEVYKLVQDSGFPGMRVLQFAVSGGSGSPHFPHNYINNCVAYTGTHDNNTLLGYVWELSEGEKADFLDYFGHGGDFDSCYDTVLRTMLSSAAGLVVFPIQDILRYGRDTRLNTPGLAEDNWAFRVTREQMERFDTAKFRRWNSLYAR